METVRSCLIGLAMSLLLVGFAGGTFVRHVVQVLPIVVALPLVSRSPGYLGAYAAATVCGFWTVAMVLSWLRLFGVLDMTSRQYSPIEILLTVLIAFFALVGFLRGVRAGRPLTGGRKIVTVVVFGGLQLVSMLVSSMMA